MEIEFYQLILYTAIFFIVHGYVGLTTARAVGIVCALSLLPPRR